MTATFTSLENKSDHWSLHFFCQILVQFPVPQWRNNLFFNIITELITYTWLKSEHFCNRCWNPGLLLRTCFFPIGGTEIKFLSKFVSFLGKNKSHVKQNLLQNIKICTGCYWSFIIKGWKTWFNIVERNSRLDKDRICQSCLRADSSKFNVFINSFGTEIPQCGINTSQSNLI